MMVFLLYNILQGNFYSINNYFMYRSHAINSIIINTRCSSYLSHIDCNVYKYSFFIRTDLMWN